MAGPLMAMMTNGRHGVSASSLGAALGTPVEGSVDLHRASDFRWAHRCCGAAMPDAIEALSEGSEQCAVATIMNVPWPAREAAHHRAVQPACRGVRANCSSSRRGVRPRAWKNRYERDGGVGPVALDPSVLTDTAPRWKKLMSQGMFDAPRPTPEQTAATGAPWRRYLDVCGRAGARDVVSGSTG